MKLRSIAPAALLPLLSLVTPPMPHVAGVTIPLADPIAYHRKPAGPSLHYKQATLALAAMAFGECRGQSPLCDKAVMNVAFNRLRSGHEARYGGSIRAIIGHNVRGIYAFSCMSSRDHSWKVIRAALEGTLKPHSPDDIRWTMALGEARIFMAGGGGADPTGGATFYHSVAVRPAWISDRGMVRTAAIDGHIFYRKG